MKHIDLNKIDYAKPMALSSPDSSMNENFQIHRPVSRCVNRRAVDKVMMQLIVTLSFFIAS